MTDPTEAQLADQADKMWRVVNARREGDMATACTLLDELCTTAEAAFILILTMARTAAWPVLQMKRKFAEANQGVQGITPITSGAVLSTPERKALDLVAAFAMDNPDDERRAFDLVGEIIIANEPATTQRVITTLVDVLAQGGPRIATMQSPFGQN